MELQTHLAALAQPDAAARRAALEAAFAAEGLVPELQTEEADETHPDPACNYLLFPESDPLCPLLCPPYSWLPGWPA